VDLSAYAGSSILLRFEYLTDQGYNGHGFAFADLAVPELGLAEPGAAEAPWSADGWLRVDAPIPQPWRLQLVRWTDAGVQVDPVPVGPDGQASISLDETASRSVLVIAPTAPRTLNPAEYSLLVS
jgi:hypothetical protein